MIEFNQGEADTAILHQEELPVLRTVSTSGRLTGFNRGDRGDR
ncbi:hypothetical protein ACLQ25_15745 [Micromonospora sp. DT44]